MSIITAIILGIIEGLTEFLPVSSTGHLTIAEKLFGYKIDDPGITAFTAIIQLGAIAATLLYFRRDILTIAQGFLVGLFKSDKRGSVYKFGWAIIIGTLPILAIGYLFKNQIDSSLRSLWLVAIALIGWSLVMFAADRFTAKNTMPKQKAGWRDTLIIGFIQCVALIPGVSRSGATISGGLFRGLSRTAATKLSFFLAIPALTAAGLYQGASEAGNISSSVGWGPTIIATIISFIAAYVSIAWLLKFVRNHNFSLFIVYRILLGLILIGLLASGTISAT